MIAANAPEPATLPCALAATDSPARLGRLANIRMTARSMLATSREAFAETPAGRPSAASPAAACPAMAGSAWPESHGGRLRRLAGQLQRVLKNGGDCYDPRFERPDLVEDDYHRFRNQPRGW